MESATISKIRLTAILRITNDFSRSALSRHWTHFLKGLPVVMNHKVKTVPHSYQTKARSLSPRLILHSLQTTLKKNTLKNYITLKCTAILNSASVCFGLGVRKYRWKKFGFMMEYREKQQHRYASHRHSSGQPSLNPTASPVLRICTPK